MALRIQPGKRLKKKLSGHAEEILAKLDSYLKEGTAGPVELLCGFWKDQQDAITYQELREAVMSGALSESTFRLWQQDYSVLVAGKLEHVWERAMAAGAANQPLTSGLPFVFHTQTPGIRNWIQERGAEFVTSSTVEQKNAIAALLSKKMVEGHTVDELARMIRPCIGLTEGQAKANARYYDSIVANLKKEHPRMKQESIQRKAQDAAIKYAERQHRYRAMTIAMTESAFAYNRGADEGVRQAQAQGLLGAVKKRWCTSGDDQVCGICQGLEGMELGMDDGFQFKGRQLFAGQNLMPPAHPRCACAVEYVEVEGALFRQESFAEYEQNDFTNIFEDGILEERFRSENDPIYEVTGSAYESHPKEVEQIMIQLKEWGVEINVSEALGYGAAKRESPGTMSITENASYSAWLHEFQHVKDAHDNGWDAAEVLYGNREERIRREKRAYQLEIDMANELQRPDIVKRLEELLENEIRRINEFYGYKS